MLLNSARHAYLKSNSSRVSGDCPRPTLTSTSNYPPYQSTSIWSPVKSVATSDSIFFGIFVPGSKPAIRIIPVLIPAYPSPLPRTCGHPNASSVICMTPVGRLVYKIFLKMRQLPVRPLISKKFRHPKRGTI